MPRIIKKKNRKKTEAEVGAEERLVEIKGAIAGRRRMLLTYGSIVLIVVIAAAGFLFFQYDSSNKSRQLEYEAYKIYYTEGGKQALSEPERLQKALDLFQKAHKVKKSAKSLFYIASIQNDLNRPDDAIASLNELVKSFSHEKDVLPLAYAKIANIQLKKGNKDEALKTFEALYKLPGGIYNDLALLESARILEGKGMKQEAEAKYKELTEKFKDSPYAAEAKAKIETTAEKKEGN